jgi:hypothetical protein
MILANPRKHTQQTILDVLNDDFQSYLCNPSVNRDIMNENHALHWPKHLSG